MRRREFITLLGSAAAAWPLAARAQQQERMRRVGVLLAGEDDPDSQALLAAFQQALQARGWAEGRNIEIHRRWTGFDPQRTAAETRELVKLKPDVIYANTTRMVIAAQKETSSIPIVFSSVTDPLGQGIVTSLARPTGNVTGFSNPEFSLLGKQLQMLKEIAPLVSRVALIIAQSNAVAPYQIRTFEAVAPSLAVKPHAAPVRDRAEIERTIEAFARESNGGLLLPQDVFTQANRNLIVELAARHRLPAVYSSRSFVTDGGLMSYDSDRNEAFRGAASYVDRILRGDKVSDLPVQQPTRFELTINLKTAKALGLSVPLALQASADEVIE